MWIRVTDRSTGHQYDIPDSQWDPDLYTKVNASRRWPDLPDYERPRPQLYRTDKGLVTAAGVPPADDAPETPPDGEDHTDTAGDPATTKEN